MKQFIIGIALILGSHTLLAAEVSHWYGAGVWETQWHNTVEV